MTMPQETTTATVGEDRRPSWHSSLGTREGGCAEFSVRPMSNHRFSSRSWPCAARRSMDYFRALRPPVSFAPQCRCGSLVDFHARNIVAISGSGSSNCRPVSRGMRSAQILCFALPMASAISWRASVLSPQPIVFTHFPGSRSL
jgi:hypothetical protein